MYQQATILAPGLLGTSLALALRQQALARRIVIWARRPEARLEALKQKHAEAAPATPEEAVEGSDLVVLCPPVEHIIPLGERLRPALAKGALVTDVGSTKSLICRHLARGLAPQATFIGSHPMAGSEKAGADHARSGLFAGRPCFLTPLDDTPPETVERLARLWQALGMDVTTTTPEHHDEIVAHVSHLPHLLASALALFLAGKEPAWAALAGNGLRDTTRIAAGSPDLWKAIFSQNREELLRALDGFEASLQQLRSALINQRDFEVRHLLEQGKHFRDRLG